MAQSKNTAGQIREVYPDLKYLKGIDDYLLFNIKSITYGVYFKFLPYDVKITESLTPEWNKETVIGRMDPISTFKRMGRTMNATFKVKARYGSKVVGSGDAALLPVDELLHAMDHLKRVLYPRYDKNQVMTSPPLFRIKYGNLIHAGEDTMGGESNGVLCTIDSYSANPIFSPNSIMTKTQQGSTNYGGIGDKSVGFYPNGFDINIGFTVFNEKLADQTDDGKGILNQKYFYDYVESIHNTETVTSNVFFDDDTVKPVEPVEQATEQKITGET
jgi:hypothetical protein